MVPEAFSESRGDPIWVYEFSRSLAEAKGAAIFFGVISKGAFLIRDFPGASLPSTNGQPNKSRRSKQPINQSGEGGLLCMQGIATIELNFSKMSQSLDIKCKVLHNSQNI